MLGLVGRFALHICAFVASVLVRLVGGREDPFGRGLIGACTRPTDVCPTGRVLPRVPQLFDELETSS